jgi:chromate transporter
VAEDPARVPLAVIAREWGRIGCIGFGGPPAHIALLRRLCVDDRGWLAAGEFEDGVAAVNLLPGPASTQLAIYCAWRLRGAAGALVGGLCFIVPGLIVILALASLFLGARPPGWVSALALGAGAAVPAVALAAAIGLIPASWRRSGTVPAAAEVPPATAEIPPAAAEVPPATAEAPPAAAEERPATAEVPAATAQVPAAGSAGSPTAARARAVARAAHLRWGGYLAAGAAAAALLGPWLVLVLAAAGLIEVAVRAGGRVGRLGRAGRPPPPAGVLALTAGGTATAAGLAAVAWVAFKVGALSYGGGFVIIPLMQRDAVHTYHWMSSAQFLTAVALGQVTPGPVVQTVAVVGYAAAGVAGGLLASAVAFAPSFAFVLGGARYFGRLRANAGVQAFLTGAGPASIGAIAGAALPLGLSLAHLWQVGVLAVAAGWLIGLRRGVVTAIVGSAALGVIVYLAGGPVT